MADGASSTPNGTPVQQAYFSPDAGEHSYLSFGGRVTWKRLILRIVLALALLAAIDVAVARTLTPAAVYEQNYRLPRTLPTASLADYTASVHDASIDRSGGPIVAFVGSSPTWGHRIKDPANTYPAAFGAAASVAGWPNRTYNFASNGQFLGDEYFIAKGLAPDADVVFVQLTYHTFNPVARKDAAVRYPEIPGLLGLEITPDEAQLLGLPPSQAAAAQSAASRALSRHWLLWRERDALDRRLFGGKPQDRLTPRPAEKSLLTSLPAGDEAGDTGFAAFEDLDPMKRMVVITRYSESSSFIIDPGDSDVRFLTMLAQMLREHGKKAVFFMAPLNRDLIEKYELIDPAQYAANVGLLRGVVTDAGFPFLDYNTGPVELPAASFADVSHTTDGGGRAFGALLYRDTWHYLGAKQP